MSFIEITIYTTQLTWHKPEYLKWESTEVIRCRIQWGEKQKALENITENYQQKWFSGPKPIQLDSVVFVFSGDCAKMNTPSGEFSTAFVNLRNHHLSRVENSFPDWDFPQKQPGEKAHPPWGSQKWFFTCQEPKHLAQDDWLQIHKVSVS